MTTLIKETHKILVAEPLVSADQLRHPVPGIDLLEVPTEREHPYMVAFAVSEETVTEAQRLRHEVFHAEMACGGGEGLDIEELDVDEFDQHMSHLVLVHRKTATIVGTYRLQTIPNALETAGIYTEHLFDLDPLEEFFGDSVELGRLCIAREHRGLNNLALLFHGVQTFVRINGMRYLFGCCSIRTDDPADGWHANETFIEKGWLRDAPLAMAAVGHSCGAPSITLRNEPETPVRIPKLFDTYMALGAKIVSLPAADPDFGTVCFLVMIDSSRVHLPPL